MKGNKKVYEIYLNSNHISREIWSKFIKVISKFIGYFKLWNIIMLNIKGEIRYYILCDTDLPATISDIEDLLIKRVEVDLVNSYKESFFYKNDILANFADIIDKEEIKLQKNVNRLEIKIRALSEEKILSSSYVYFEKDNKLYRKKLLFSLPHILLSIDFVKNSKYFYKKYVSYFDIQKTKHLFYTDINNSLLKVDTFPYLQGNYYLKQKSYDFDKHSMIIGSSGSGKSKMISLLVNNLYEDNNLKQNYKVVIIDPHASLQKDIGGLEDSTVLNFESLKSSINLFDNQGDNVISSTENIMSILKSLIGDNYNSKLERVLRYSVHLLILFKKFDFNNLRMLLLNTEYRISFFKNFEVKVPLSLKEFFLTEYGEIKNKYYDIAISPIISFIDEIQLLPVFSSSDDVKDNLRDVIQENFLTLFSLNRVSIGENGVKSISSLIMQQLMQIVQSRHNNEHIILIVDEVSVVENPILMSFLSEARKFNLSVILAQQYFNQISLELQNAIFANVMNYYVFRVSRSDALVLVNNLSIKMPKKGALEDQIDLLVNLSNRQCVVRICENGVILPALKGETVDFEAKPLKQIVFTDNNINIDSQDQQTKKKFELGTSVNLFDLLLDQSSGRRNMRGEVL